MLIIPCGSEKLTTSDLVQAKDLYVGQLFRAIWRKATTLDEDVWILSAGYGLIRPNTMVRKYDRKMNQTLAAWMQRELRFERDACHLLPEVYAAVVPSARKLLKGRLTLGRFISAVGSMEDGPFQYQERPNGEVVELLQPPPLKQVHRKGGAIGILAFIRNSLLTDPLTIDELSARLTGQFGPPMGASWTPTIRAQLRIQCQRHNLSLTRDGEKYRFHTNDRSHA